MDKLDGSTIFALSTAFGKSAVAIIRASGPNLQEIVKANYISKIPKPRVATLADIKLNNALIDSAVMIYFAGPNSFTGEDILELNIHGSKYTIQKILDMLNMLPGFRLAKPGEFIQRAFFNNRLNIRQVEQTLDIINAETEIEHKIATSDNIKHVSKKLNNLVRDALVQAEAYIDFSDNPENDITADIEGILKKIIDYIYKIKNNWDQLKKVREGLVIAIAGKPNSGKSSVMNALTHESTSIVSKIAGTTRDAVSTSIEINNVKARLIDTAGIRSTDNEIEKIGIAKAKDVIQNADIILNIIDASDIKNDILQTPSAKTILVFNKIDICSQPDGEIGVSAKHNIGISELIKEIQTKVSKYEITDDTLTTRNHHAFIDNILTKIQCIIEEIDRAPLDLTVEHIRRILSLTAYESYTTYTNEELLASIFNQFCIGK